jgi:hypothetical protein
VLSSEQLLADTASTRHVLRRVASFLNVSRDAAAWSLTAIREETGHTGHTGKTAIRDMAIRDATNSRNSSPRQQEQLDMDISLTARAPSSESPAAPASASSAARRGDVAFQRFNCSTQDRILDVFHRHNHALFDLLRSTRREAPAEQETLDEFPDPRSPECLNLKVHNASSMKY